MESATLTFGKEERICSRKLIEKLFGGGHSRSLAAYPLRAVYLETERDEAQPAVQILISVPKRCLRHAVERNRVKRQVREAYRHHRQMLLDRLSGTPERGLAVAFIWLDDRLHTTETVDKRVRNLLERIGERL